MDLFDIVQAQMETVKLPLYAVTVSAVAQVNTPLVAILHWHGFCRATPLVLPGVDIPARPVPGSAIQIGAPWHSFEAVDMALLDAAWRLGAWEVERIERRACNVIGASGAEALACRRAFGDYGEGSPTGEHLLDGAPDREGLMHLAARRGYLRWLFRPVKGGVLRALDEPDDSLGADGGRTSPCPVVPKPRARGVPGRIVYRLGSVRHILLR